MSTDIEEQPKHKILKEIVQKAKDEYVKVVHETSKIEDNVEALTQGIKARLNDPESNTTRLQLYDNDHLNDETIPEIMKQLGEGYGFEKKISNSAPEVTKGKYELNIVPNTLPEVKQKREDVKSGKLKKDDVELYEIRDLGVSLPVGDHVPFKEVSYIFYKKKAK